MLYIDMAAHILTPNFTKKYAQLVPAIKDRIEMKTPAVADLEIRMRLMSRYPQVLQVLTMAICRLSDMSGKWNTPSSWRR